MAVAAAFQDVLAEIEALESQEMSLDQRLQFLQLKMLVTIARRIDK
jgi:hypothetical protein